MSDKKKLLTESEIRRFMTLANIPAIGNDISEGGGQIPQDATSRRPHSVRPGDEARLAQEEELAGPDDMGGEEMMDVGDLAGDAGGEAGDDKEAKFEQVVQMLADLVGIDVEVEAGEGEAAPEMGGEEAGKEKAPEAPEAPEMGGEGEGEGEEAEEEEEEEEEGDAEEEMQEGMYEEEQTELDEEKEEQDEGKKLDENLVNTVLARVTARLIEEAKKKKAEKKKKMTAAEKMKALKDKKKKLDEANAPAPKSTTSNGPKAAGKATKGTFGVTSKVADMEWKQGKEGKGGHEMSTESASSEHMTTHGKKNLATMGGNKKK